MDVKELAYTLYLKFRKGDLESFRNVLIKSLEKERTEKLRLVKTPVLNSIGREFGKLIAEEDWFQGMLNLWRISLGCREGREIRYIVINALGVISRRNYDDAMKFILRILYDLGDWETVDALALRVIVNLAKQNRREVFQLLREWTASNNKWVRRLAMASIATYIRARPSDAEHCLKIVENLMEEEDRDVRKAVAWALREISKKNPRKVYDFLQKYINSRNKNTRWIVKEGSRKLPIKLNKDQRPSINY